MSSEDQTVTAEQIRNWADVAESYGSYKVASDYRKAANALEAVQAERDYLVSEYERALGIEPQGFLHAAEHIYNAIVNGKSWERVAERCESEKQEAESENSRLADELRRVREALDSLSDHDVWIDIDQAAHTSMRRYLRSIGGQTLSPPDGIEWHVMQEVRRRIKDALSTTEPQDEQPEPDTKSLTFEAFRRANVKRCEQKFFSVDNWNLLEWAGAMCGEAGEAANVAKKLVRDKYKKATTGDLAEEIGGTVAYLDLLASRAGLRLEDCTVSAFNQVSERIGTGIRLPEPDTTEQAEWIRHDGGPMPSDLALMQLIEASIGPCVDYRGTASDCDWSGEFDYRPVLSADGLPCCDGRDLEKWARYVVTDRRGQAWQSNGLLRRETPNDGGAYSWEWTAIKEGTKVRPASATYARPGNPAHSIMEVVHVSD